jgi:molybdate transport system ATP-binding protein
MLGGRRVLHDLDWTLQPGEHWAVFGGNGAGKTSFLRLLAGELWPAPGGGRRTYDFGGGPQRDAVLARRWTRLVTPELHDRFLRRRTRMTGARLVATGFADSPILRGPPSPADAAVASDMLGELGLADLAARRWSELSRGEQRLLLLVRAMVTRPRLLMLYEICDGLDAGARRRVLQVVDQLAAAGAQMVFATHRPAELPGCVTRVLRLADGRIAATTPPDNRQVREPWAPPAVGSNLVRLRGVTLYRGDRPVLRDLDWRIRGGERWQLRGANGVGKSSLLKLLHGDLRPALGGSIEWFGTGALPDIWAVRRRTGLVSDDLQARYAGYVTVTQCVATGFNASIGRAPALDPERRRTVAAVLADLGLSALAGVNVQALSHGQFRRVLLARALVQRPALLLLDEPFSGLDAGWSAVAWRCLRQLADRDTAVVFASHEPVPDPAFFNRTLKLADGRAGQLPTMD